MEDSRATRDENDRIHSFYHRRYGESHDLPVSIHFGFTPLDRPKSENPDSASETQEMNRVLASEAGITESDTVLDAGCGFGGSSVWLAETFGCGVVGLNLIETQLQKARSHATASGVDRLTEFVSGDFTDTKLQSESFDVVWAIESVCHTSDKEGFLREAARLLNPGGRLVVADFFLSEDRPLNESGQRSLTRFASGWSIPDLLRESNLRELATSIGLSQMNVRDISENVMPSSEGMYREAMFRSYSKNFVYSKLGLRPREDFTNARSCILQYRTLKQKLWFYGILGATKSRDNISE